MPSATAEKEMTNPLYLNQKISRLRETYWGKCRNQDLLFCRNGGSSNQINLRFEYAENAFKATIESGQTVDCFKH